MLLDIGIFCPRNSDWTDGSWTEACDFGKAGKSSASKKAFQWTLSLGGGGREERRAKAQVCAEIGGCGKEEEKKLREIGSFSS